MFLFKEKSGTFRSHHVHIAKEETRRGVGEEEKGEEEEEDEGRGGDTGRRYLPLGRVP